MLCLSYLTLTEREIEQTLCSIRASFYKKKNKYICVNSDAIIKLFFPYLQLGSHSIDSIGKLDSKIILMMFFSSVKVFFFSWN